jgi:hypothetical protein
MGQEIIKKGIFMRFFKMLVLFSVLFCACAKSVKYQIGSPDLASSNQIKLTDRRPEKEKKAEAMSLNKNNCWFGVYRIGDDQLTPQKMEILTSILQLNLKDKVNGKSLVVNRFEVFNNIQLGMKKAVSMASFGMVKPVPSASEIKSGKCGDAFSLDINPENMPSVIVLYDVVLDGKAISGKIVQLDPKNINDDNARSPTVRERIRKGISRAAEEISNRYSE